MPLHEKGDVIFGERPENLRRLLNDVLGEVSGLHLGVGVQSKVPNEIEVELSLGGKSVLTLSIVVVSVGLHVPCVEQVFFDRYVLPLY